MSNLIEHAKRELAYEKKPDGSVGGQYEKAVKDAVMELVEAFAKQGHSGLSAELTLSLFNKVARFHCLFNLSHDEGEWMDLGIDNLQQNKRMPNVFRYKDNPWRAYTLDGIVWQLEDAGSYTNRMSCVWFDIPGQPPETIYVSDKEPNKHLAQGYTINDKFGFNAPKV